MIATRQPYPEYKEAEHPWLGRVLQHWPVVPQNRGNVSRLAVLNPGLRNQGRIPQSLSFVITTSFIFCAIPT